MIDSRRPFHLDNVFNKEAVRLLAYSSEMTKWNLPRVDEVYAPSESDESEDDKLDDEDELSDEENPRRRIAEKIAERALKRRRREQWKRRKQELLWEYYMKTWYSTPVGALFLFRTLILGVGDDAGANPHT